MTDTAEPSTGVPTAQAVLEHLVTSLVEDRDAVRIELGDGSKALPIVRRPAPEDTGGRGFVLVDAIAGSWGVVETVGGKRVWVELPVPPP